MTLLVTETKSQYYTSYTKSEVYCSVIKKLFMSKWVQPVNKDYIKD